jgi:hypothetical protein
MRTLARGWPIWTVWGSSMKPKFKLGDRVKFTRVAQRNMTLLAAENDPKPWYDVKWVSREARCRVRNIPQESQALQALEMIYLQRANGGSWSVIAGVQEGIYIGTRTKQNGLLITNHTEDGRPHMRFKRLASVPCGLVVTDARKSPRLVLIEDLEHV